MKQFNIEKAVVSNVLLAILLICFLAVLPSSAQSGGSYDLKWSTIDGGGGRSSGGPYSLICTIGQPDASEPLIGSGFVLTGGFWFGLPPDDCNSDGGVNLYDFADFEFCLAGPRREPPQRWCLCFDQDGDRDVDVLDFAELQAFFESP